MSSSTTSTRRSTRTRGGATSASASASASSALQPVATNNTSSKTATKKASAQNKTSKSTAAKNSTSVSSSYSLRKRAASTSTTNEADDDDNANSTNSALAMVNHGALYSDKDFEALLRHHEEQGQRQREDKRRKLEGPYPYRPNPDGTIGNGNLTVALDQLPGPVITIIFEMLPRCRDILNLGYQSKYLLTFVERRHDLIVRAAVHENAMAKIAPKKKRGGNSNNAGNGNGGGDGTDGNAADQQQQLQSSGAIGWSGNKKVDGCRKIMTQLAEDVRSRALHVPSPLRLLRLLCAQSCERGEQCWDYNTEKETAGTRLGVEGAARPFGMALCHKCSNDACRTIPRWWNQ